MPQRARAGWLRKQDSDIPADISTHLHIYSLTHLYTTHLSTNILTAWAVKFGRHLIPLWTLYSLGALSFEHFLLSPNSTTQGGNLMSTSNAANAVPSNSNQLSIFDLNSTFPSTPDNIIPFPVYTSTSPQPRHKHTQQRVSPIRDPEKVNEIYNTLLNSGRYGLRNATIFALQLKIGRRTNDIARMKISDVFDFKKHTIKTLITVDEHKTGKTARDLPLDSKIRELLMRYIVSLKNQSPDALLFPSQKSNADGTQRPLNTSSLDNIYQKYTSQVFTPDDDMTHISTYAARKTYGYNIYTTCMEEYNGQLPGTDINALQYVQSVFNHNSTTTTLRYIGAYDAPATKLVEDISGKYDF